MGELSIVRVDSPGFREPCSRVTLDELRREDFQQFLDDFATTCKASGAVGLGAPQVGVRKRVIVVCIDPFNLGYPGQAPLPLTWVINPEIVERSKDIEIGTEGSVSSDERVQVARSKRVTVSGLDRHGNELEMRLTDPFHARVFQHEIDYLDGRLFTDLAI